MITELRIDNLKRFSSEITLPCGKLNLLTGNNSRGKSTALQPLLLLHQLFAGNSLERNLVRLPLNGDSAQLGTCREIRHRDRKVDPVSIGFGFRTEDGEIFTRFTLTSPGDDERYVTIDQLHVEWEHTDAVDDYEITATPASPIGFDLRTGTNMPAALTSLLTDQITSLQRLHHIGADRIGPQEFFPRVNSGAFVTVGVHGERCAEALFWCDREQRTIQPSMVAPKAEDEAQTVSAQASAWLSYVFHGAGVKLDTTQSSVLALEFKTDSSGYVRPSNTGFGFSYVLPIVVAGLMAQPGDILVAENPEAHLNPAAQVRLGEFLARVAAAEVQVFIESHSEHILNAVRLAVHSKTMDLSAKDTRVFYFDDIPSHLVLVEIQEDGRIRRWPPGFFDQRLESMTQLIADPESAGNANDG